MISILHFPRLICLYQFHRGNSCVARFCLKCKDVRQVNVNLLRFLGIVKFIWIGKKSKEYKFANKYLNNSQQRKRQLQFHLKWKNNKVIISNILSCKYNRKIVNRKKCRYSNVRGCQLDKLQINLFKTKTKNVIQNCRKHKIQSIKHSGKEREIPFYINYVKAKTVNNHI